MGRKLTPEARKRGKYRPPWYAQACELYAKGNSCARIRWLLKLRESDETVRYWVDPLHRADMIARARKQYWSRHERRKRVTVFRINTNIEKDGTQWRPLIEYSDPTSIASWSLKVSKRHATFRVSRIQRLVLAAKLE